MLPEQIRTAVAVQIADGADAPIGILYLRNAEQRAFRNLQAVHQPGGGAAIRDVLPDEVHMAIGVEIAGADHLPVRVSNLAGRQQSAFHQVGAIHQPAGDSSISLVMPEEVEPAVAIQIESRHGGAFLHDHECQAGDPQRQAPWSNGRVGRHEVGDVPIAISARASGNDGGRGERFRHPRAAHLREKRHGARSSTAAEARRSGE